MEENSLDFADKITVLDKNTGHTDYFKSRIRSSSVIKFATEQSFTNLYNSRGGKLSWQEPEIIN
jgi:hypothetical protein